MTAKTLLLPLLLGAMVLSALLLVYQLYGSPPTVAEIPEPPAPASAPSPAVSEMEVAPEPRAHVAKPRAEKPGKPTWRPGMPFDEPNPVPPAKATPKKPGPDKPESKSPPKKAVADKPWARSTLAVNPTVRTWKVPPLNLPKDRIDLQVTPSVAISDDGTRVIVQNHPAVDFWDPASARNVRVLPPDVAQLSGAILAQDASRAYVRNEKTKKVETYDGTGALISNLPAIGFVGFGLQRAGYDCSSRDFVLATKNYDLPSKGGKGRTVPTETGIFEFDPDGGDPRLVVPIKDVWDTHNVQRLLRLPGGEFLAYYNTTRPGKNLRGLFTIAKDGTFTNVPGLPSKDMAHVTDVTISPDGRYLAFLGSNRLELWDLPDKKRLLDWREEYRFPRMVRFTGDGRLAIASMETTLKAAATSNLSPGPVANSTRIDVLNTFSLRVAGQLYLADFDLPDQAFAFSPNGKRMVLADGKRVAVIDVDAAFPAK